MDAIERQIWIYRTSDDKEPFTEWLHDLRDQRGRQKIQAKLARVRLGNFGDWRAVGDGVSELKINFGPGYRVYFGLEGIEVVILLCGGDKGSQDSDIAKAKTYWADFQQEKRHADY